MAYWTHTGHRRGAVFSLSRHLDRFLAGQKKSRNVRLARHRLRSLDDHLLRDIGIERGDIDEAVRYGRW